MMFLVDDLLLATSVSRYSMEEKKPEKLNNEILDAKQEKLLEKNHGSK